METEKKAEITGLSFGISKTEIFEEEEYKKDYIKVVEMWSDGSEVETDNFSFYLNKDTGVLTVTHTPTGESKEFSIKVKNKPTLARVRAEISKSTVNLNGEYPRDAITVTEIYSDGTSQVSDNFNYQIDTSKAGKTTLTVTYLGANDAVYNFTVDVVDTVKLVGISAEYIGSSPLSIEDSSKLKTSDFEVLGIYSDDTEERLDSFKIDIAYDNNENPTKVIATIYHILSSDEVDDSVSPAEVVIPLDVKQDESEEGKKIEKVDFFLDPNYIYVGEDLAEEQVYANVVYSDGSGEKVTKSDLTLDFTPKGEPGKYDISVSYGEAHGVLSVTVKSADENDLVSIEATCSVGVLTTDTEVPKESIKVTGYYRNGETKEIEDFDVKLENSGVHGVNSKLTITVVDENGKSYTVTIRNVPTKSPESWTKVSSTYVGDKMIKDEKIIVQGDDDFELKEFRVVATLADGTEKELDPEKKEYEIKWKDEKDKKVLVVSESDSFDNEFSQEFDVMIVEKETEKETKQPESKTAD